MARPLTFHSLKSAAVALAVASCFTAPVRAQELADDQMAPFQFSGVINADKVYVRSYSSENDYPTVQLSKGDAVIVMGNKNEWLKILPPEGSFCLVGKAWVEVRGDGSVGRVREEAGSPNVRIGSSLVASYGKIVTQVKAGEDVKILGQQDEYFKIAPPAGAFVYVHKKFVDLVKRVEVVNQNGRLTTKQPAADVTPAPKPPEKTPTLVEVPAPPTPGTQPNNSNNTAVAEVPPATQPTETAAAPVAKDESFEALEAKFNAATKQPLAEQPIEELIEGYSKVVAAKQVPETSLRVAEFRLKGLALRKEANDALKQSNAAREQREAAQKPLIAEASEITQRMAANEFKRYTAVGRLSTSALPHNGKTLYRLTDPATGRTLIYVDAGPDAAGREGTFVGVRGTIADDTTRQIKIIAPQAIEAVDPADLNRGTVTSGMVPPSMSIAVSQQ